VLRPGIRVSAGFIASIATANFQVTGLPAGEQVEEVDPQRGMIFFRETMEGRQVSVQYVVGGTVASEVHTVTYRDETGDVAVPLDTSINEGGLDSFASYEFVSMLNNNGQMQPVQHLEKMWLFWSSTRGASAASDIFFGTIAPRIGPMPDNPSAILTSGALSPSVARMVRVNGRAIPALRDLPFSPVLPTRRGPLIKR
jgi:hypothetical protein